MSLALLGACGIAVSLGRKARRRSGGGVWLGMSEEKGGFGGLLGQPVGGKVD
jgi:hypothetical protein